MRSLVGAGSATSAAAAAANRRIDAWIPGPDGFLRRRVVRGEDRDRRDGPTTLVELEDRQAHERVASVVPAFAEELPRLHGRPVGRQCPDRVVDLLECRYALHRRLRNRVDCRSRIRGNLYTKSISHVKPRTAEDLDVPDEPCPGAPLP